MAEIILMYDITKAIILLLLILPQETSSQITELKNHPKYNIILQYIEEAYKSKLDYIAFQHGII